ncbi:hypothetical protein MTsPCn9_11890 [Croceitalea sp. MTPC9]|uniref:hypothetical protein n=1 Tax=unclassified Croceitalea TaxID=2632280 RepID=UPI002B378BAB|nr:hypothetical protein MTsPCn6_31750 [Croceitalea sp. MTPC6]GMN16253.1 hypothetical protein MTsPCn9_11890 [Croceitalea sp. MTPC9]
MFKFFRAIRQTLLSEKRLSKYLVYAVGELFLIVFGILIALQLNNWNENGKSREVEIKILIELRKAISDDLQLLNFSYEGNKGTQKSCSIILLHLEQNLPYHDSLALHFENANLWWKVAPRAHAYEKAKLYGLDFIKNDSTRILLTQLYEERYVFAETLDQRQSQFYYSTVTPILIELFKSIEVTWQKPTSGNVPLDYEALKTNERYKTILRTSIGQREYFNGWIKLLISHIEELDQLLLTEVEKR